MLYQFILGLFIALAGSLIAVFIDSPLPWMLAALVLTATSRMAGLQTSSHHRTSNAW